MSLLLFAILVALTNLVAGYTLACYLGYGPPTLSIALDALFGGGRPANTEPADYSLPTDDAGAAEAAEPTEVAPSGQSAPSECDPSPTVPDDLVLNETYAETSILKLNIAMMRSGKRVTEIDRRLRAEGEVAGHEAIFRAIEDLRADCQGYLAEQAAATESLRARLDEFGELKALGGEIELANLQQAAQIETTLSNLGHMDFASNLPAAAARLFEEIQHLQVARHGLRDRQEAVFVAIARREGRLDQIDPRLQYDPLTRLRNRIGLEVAVRSWCGAEKTKARTVSAALVDLDGFGHLNGTYGPLAGDRVLHHVGRLVERLTAAEHVAARFAGQRFALVLPDAGPRAATKNVEKLRQSIERITFLCGEESVRVTAGCGVAQAKPGEDLDDLWERLDKAVAAAKEEGGNRTCLDNGKEIEPIESPSLGAPYAEITI